MGRSWQKGLPGAMSIISWNCLGLGHPRAVPSLRDLVRSYRPDVLFLCETLVHADKIEEIRVRLGFDSAFAVDCVGRSGGLALLWRHPFDCTVTNYCVNFIDAEVVSVNGPSWRLTGFYGCPESGRRRESWNLLRTLARDNSLPWCVVGDFNDLLSNEEKRGSADRAPWLLRGFRDAIQDCLLYDIPMQGHPFTWSRGRGTDDFKEERLDRVLATQDWIDIFPNCSFINGVADRSDHTPLWLQLWERRHRGAPRPFRFENAWLEEEDLPVVVEEGWSNGGDCDLMRRVENCTNSIDAWGRRLRTRYRLDIKKCKEEMEVLRGSMEVGDMHRYKEVNNRLSTLLAQEEAFWKQRAKVHWLRDGDTNSKFFHAMASTRRRRNAIVKLSRDDGTVADSQAALGEVAKDYFTGLFEAADGDYRPVVDCMRGVVSREDNNQLLAPFDIGEFKEALFQMHSDKAPGPDGLNPAFFKRFWNLCGPELFHSGVAWLDGGEFPPMLNDANIVLIPKVDNPTTMRDLRPISLCNVIYKIISKVLANRLKDVLYKCVSLEQSAFVPGRSILDNVMVAIETIHHLKCKVRGKAGEVALKIDISKAYDRVDWGYLRCVLDKLGFHEKWVSWMMMCVETVNYSVLMNGERAGSVSPGRGLRQGDPLSPYLFILCAEGLTALLKKCEARGEIHGVKVCRGAPILTHLLFADDCFLFCRADVNETTKLKEVLQTYEKASGQSINLQKSEIYFSRNTTEDIREQVVDILGVTECLGTGKYLGLPSMVGRSKKQLFSYLRDRVWNKVRQWSGRHLSKAGREVLVKSVAQAIPTYCMSTFLIPTSLGEEMERMINSFWWGSNRGARRGINWLSWDRLSMRKEYGGMGFRHFYGFNLAMLGKQGWRLCTNKDAIVTRVFKSKYFPNGDFLGARLGHNPSYVWRSIHTSQVLVNFGARWKIGDGTSINIWKDPWLKGGNNSFVSSTVVPGCENMMVSNLFNASLGSWNISLLDQLFNEEDKSRIKGMVLHGRDIEDKLVWDKSRDGLYSVKSAYYVCMNELIDNSEFRVPGEWNSIWKLKVPQKVKIHLWRCARGVLPSRSNLRRRHVNCPVECPWCENEEESDWHLFLGCSQAETVWRQAGLWSTIQRILQAGAADFKTVVFNFLQVASVSYRNSFAMLIWCLWKRRNEKVWENTVRPIRISINSALDFLYGWQHVRRPTPMRDSHQPRRDVAVAWSRPAEGFVKCNVDAALFDDNRYGIGLCIRNSDGSFFKAKTTWFYGAPPPQEAEALGLLLAVNWLQELNLQRVTIELDCKAVVDGISGVCNSVTEFGSILRTCKTSLSLLQNYTVSFIRRQANLVAHTLARASREFASSQVHDCSPICITTIIMNEMH